VKLKTMVGNYVRFQVEGDIQELELAEGISR
jgi:hypothetical protein